MPAVASCTTLLRQGNGDDLSLPLDYEQSNSHETPGAGHAGLAAPSVGQPATSSTTTMVIAKFFPLVFVRSFS